MGEKHDDDFECMDDFEARLERAGYDQWQEPDPWDGDELDAQETWDPIFPRPPRGSLGLKEGFDEIQWAIRELRSLREKPILSDAQRRRYEHCQQIVAKELQLQPATMRKRGFAVGPDTGPGPGEWWEPDYRAVAPGPAVKVETVKRRGVTTRQAAPLVPPAAPLVPALTESPSERIKRLATERKAQRKAKLPWSTPCLIEVFGAKADAIRESSVVA